MVSSVQREMAFRQKLQVLRTLSNSKSVTKSSIIMDALNYINHLKFKVEELNRECGNRMQQLHIPTDVKVQRVEKGFQVTVTCRKEKGVLVSVIEVFEEKGLNVLNAKISCDPFFFMEAIIEAPLEALDVEDVTQAIYKALGSKLGMV